MRAALASILLIEIALFAWSFGKFFCGDSLFYLWFRVNTPARLLEVFTRPDHLYNYRPLTYVIATYLLFPLFHLNPVGYHFVTLGVHLLVTVLAFRMFREWVRPGAALAGAFFFGVHGVNFYLTYDLTFLPDFSSGLFSVMALAGYVLFRRGRGAAWLAFSLGSFVLGLLCKESVIMLPAGLMAAEVLCASANRPGAPAANGADGPRRFNWLALAPFVVVSAAYLAWSLYMKGGRLYPAAQNDPYALTLAWGRMQAKLQYLAWAFNLPAGTLARRWPAYAAWAAMLPALGWIAVVVARAFRHVRLELAACCVWSLAALLPVLGIRQVPMHHNLYIPVLALATALAVAVDRSGLLGPRAAQAPGAPTGRLLPRGWAYLALGMAASTAFMIPASLKASWVGAASDISRASLDSVRASYPSLPHGATLYLLPAHVKGDVSWYFLNGALFNLFYNDPSIEMRFADLGHALPPDFASRRDLFIFEFAEGRIWDVTRSYKRDALDHETLRLLDREPAVENRLNWAPGTLIEGTRTVAKRAVVRDGQCRTALVQMPGTIVTFPLEPIPPDAVLQIGLSLAGPLSCCGHARILFESSSGVELLEQVTLDIDRDAGHWRDWEIDLSRLAGRSGDLRLQTEPDQAADWLAWSRMRIVSRTSPFYPASNPETSRPPSPREFRLLDRLDEAEVSFDRSEVYPDYARFDTPGGVPVFLFANRRPSPPRYSMVAIAGATARFRIREVPPGAVLELSAINAGQIGDGVRARVLVQAETSEVLFDELLKPRARQWVDREIPLRKWERRPITLVFESSSGPNHRTPGDWCALSRLRIQ